MIDRCIGIATAQEYAEIVKRMVELGISDWDICKSLGMDADEVLRFKRNVKIAEIYKDLNYSNSWKISK